MSQYNPSLPQPETVEVQKVRPVWIAMKNSDLTEGKGYAVIHAVCETMTTAERLGKGQNVQGSNCSIHEGFGYRINGMWYYPGRLCLASAEDKERQKEKDAVNAVLEKVREAGITSDEIDLIKRYIP